MSDLLVPQLPLEPVLPLQSLHHDGLPAPLQVNGQQLQSLLVLLRLRAQLCRGAGLNTQRDKCLLTDTPKYRGTTLGKCQTFRLDMFTGNIYHLTQNPRLKLQPKIVFFLFNDLVLLQQFLAEFENRRNTSTSSSDLRTQRL